MKSLDLVKVLIVSPFSGSESESEESYSEDSGEESDHRRRDTSESEYSEDEERGHQEEYAYPEDQDRRWLRSIKIHTLINLLTDASIFMGNLYKNWIQYYSTESELLVFDLFLKVQGRQKEILCDTVSIRAWLQVWDKDYNLWIWKHHWYLYMPISYHKKNHFKMILFWQCYLTFNYFYKILSI